MTLPISSTSPTGPLAGIRILDLTTVVLGPLATQILGDYGADVIKLETVDGDLMRANGVSRSPGMSSIFLAINRNKQSIAVNLKTEAGREIALRLAANVDVFVHNMRVPAIERPGLGYEAVAAINPDVVYCAATGFGQDGPYASRPAFDDIIQAASGLATLIGKPTGKPEYAPTLIADKTAGMAVVNAVLAALFHRQRTGAGQYVEIPMFETLVAFNMAEHLNGLTFMPTTEPAGYGRITSGGRRPTPTADGYIGVLPYSPAHWAALFRRVGHEELVEKYQISNRARLNATVRDLYRELAAIAVHKTTDEWLGICAELDIPVTPLYELDDLPEHPHAKAVGLFEETDHPTEGRIRQVRTPTRFAKTPANVHRLAPNIGEQTRALLQELGYEEERVRALIDEGVVVQFAQE